MASVLVPILYVFVVFGGLWIFSTLYKRHTSTKIVEPYFGRHIDRDIYVSLLQKADPPASESLLKAALIRRAITDVHRVMRLREDKPALQNLLQKGSIGDDLWASFQAAEKEMEAEVLETAAEANSFVEGWGNLIFPTATEMLQNEKTRTIVESLVNIRAEKEQRYGVKTNQRVLAAPVPAGAVPVSNTSGTPAPANVSIPSTPSTPLSPATTLVSPASSKAESLAASSDGEGSAPRTPTKSAKKNKKRK